MQGVLKWTIHAWHAQELCVHGKYAIDDISISTWWFWEAGVEV